MIPQRWIEAYLRFLLRYRGTVTIIVVIITVFFAVSMTKMRLHTDFFDFYPKFQTFTDAFAACREEAGTSLPSCIVRVRRAPRAGPVHPVLQRVPADVRHREHHDVILEVKHGDIYNPETLQKLDRITKYIVNTKGVVPYQILSIAHPKVKSITTRAGALQIRRDLLSRACRRRRRTPSGCASRSTRRRACAASSSR